MIRIDHKNEIKMKHDRIKNKVQSSVPKAVKFFFIALLVIAGILLFTYVVMLLWNWLMPFIFDLPPLTYLQAGGVLVLSKILFGGFGKGNKKSCCCNSGRKGWSEKMKARWGNMSKEEKEAFKQKYKDRSSGFGKCGPDSNDDFEELEMEADANSNTKTEDGNGSTSTKANTTPDAETKEP